MSFRRFARLLSVTAIVAITGSLAQAEGIPPVEWTFAGGGSVRFYGQINKGFLTFNDGQETETYNFIDNYNSNTRFGLTYDQTLGRDWAYQGRFELQYDPFSTNTANILEPKPSSSAYQLTTSNIRYIDNRFTSRRDGVFYLGQGDMASNNTAEVDFSGTKVIAYSEVQDSAGGQYLRLSDGTLSDVTIDDAFTNYDGLSRAVRIRYDTALFNGFGARASYGQYLLSDDASTREEILYDVVATYEGRFDSFKIAAQAAYSVKGSETTIIDGSASVLHEPTGLSVTIASGSQDKSDAVGSYGYIKLGWQADLVSWGSTAIAVDAYSGTDIAAPGSESKSTSLSLVQTIDRANTELWATWRSYDFQQDGADYNPADAFFIGARFTW
ncbi:MAG: porin [Rhodobacterales bacterium]|nr:porin [Rhodobacterales bacterium]